MFGSKLGQIRRRDLQCSTTSKWGNNLEMFVVCIQRLCEVVLM